MEKHGGSTFFAIKNVARFFPPWTVTRSDWLHALRPDVSGMTVDALLFNNAGRWLVHRYRIYRDPFPHGVVPHLLSCVCRAMAIAQLTHLIISIPSSGAPPRRGHYAGELPGGSPKAESLPLIWWWRTAASRWWRSWSSWCHLPWVPVCRLHRASHRLRGRSMTGGMDVDELCSRIGVDCSPSLSPISRVCTDVSNSAVSLGVGVLVSPIIDGSSDVAPAVGHAGLTLPSVDNSFVQDMLRAPAAPQDTRSKMIGRSRCLGGGWLARVRSSRSTRQSPSVPWGPGAHSDIQLSAPK